MTSSEKLETLLSCGNSCWPFLMGIRTPKSQYPTLPPTPSPPQLPRYKTSPNLWKTTHLLTSQEAWSSYPAVQKLDSAMIGRLSKGEHGESLVSNQASCLSKTARRIPSWLKCFTHKNKREGNTTVSSALLPGLPQWRVRSTAARHGVLWSCERGKKQRAATFKSYWWIRQSNTAVVNLKQLAHFPVSQVQKALTGALNPHTDYHLSSF